MIRDPEKDCRHRLKNQQTSRIQAYKCKEYINACGHIFREETDIKMSEEAQSAGN